MVDSSSDPVNCVFCTMKLLKEIDLSNALRVRLEKLGAAPEQGRLVAYVIAPRCEEHEDIHFHVLAVEGEEVVSEPKLYDDAVKLFKCNPLTRDEALWIRALLVDMECSMGRIGELYEKNGIHEELRQLGTSCVQDFGRALCVLAAEKLGQDKTKEPWEL